jgi:crotonobetainyl-CoA:carnitine CoA-transferase CaiB-like acyl-CoA transferase
MSLPLADIRVIDLAQVLAGPFGAAMLADLGAEVIKVEPVRGDESRHLGVGFGLDSAMFVGANRNKRGLALDLASSDGQEILGRLLATADIVVDNMRPAAKEKLGIDFASLQAVNPHLISINVSAFGTTGPYAGRPGIDPLAQALGGLMSVTGEPGGTPLKTGSPIVDATTAHLVVISAFAALRRRDKYGKGELIEVNLLDALFNLQPTVMSQYLVAGHEQPVTGCGSDLMAPYGQFRCKDGRYWQITALNQKFFANICSALECEHLLEDERFTDNTARMQNQAELEELLGFIVAQYDSGELERRFAHADVLAAPVNSIPEAVSNPQLLHNGMITEVQHARLGRIKSARLPVRFADHDEEREQRAAPTLGQHNAEVLTELGYSTEDIAALYSAGTIKGDNTKV